MKLYYLRGSCSLAPHIALREAGMAFELVRFAKDTHEFSTGQRLEEINEKGYVPVLELDSGERLTEVGAVLQYIADRAPASGLAPPNRTMERYRLQEWLSFISSEIHKSFWPFFHDGCEAEKPTVGERLQARLTWLDGKMKGREFLMDRFTVADCYLLTVVNWIRPAGLDVTKWPVLGEYRLRLRERPSVQAALEAEGLLKRS